MMKFDEPAARRRWDAYFAEVERLLAQAGPAAAGLRGELEAHVAESMRVGSEGDEAARLEGALARLGRPAEYLEPLIAEALIAEGTRSSALVARELGRAALTGARRGGTALAFGLGYLLLAIFAAMAVLKPFRSDGVGLFRLPDGAYAAGIVAPSPGAQELLGWWTVPLALAVALLLYAALTRGLRAVRR